MLAIFTMEGLSYADTLFAKDMVLMLDRIYIEKVTESIRKEREKLSKKNNQSRSNLGRGRRGG